MTGQGLWSVRWWWGPNFIIKADMFGNLPSCSTSVIIRQLQGPYGSNQRDLCAIYTRLGKTPYCIHKWSSGKNENNTSSMAKSKKWVVLVCYELISLLDNWRVIVLTSITFNIETTVCWSIQFNSAFTTSMPFTVPFLL